MVLKKTEPVVGSRKGARAAKQDHGKMGPNGVSQDTPPKKAARRAALTPRKTIAKPQTPQSASRKRHTSVKSPMNAGVPARQSRKSSAVPLEPHRTRKADISRAILAAAAPITSATDAVVYDGIWNGPRDTKPGPHLSTEQGISKKKKTARAAQAEGPKGKTGTKEAATKREGAPTRSQGPSEVAPASSSPARATARLAGSPSRSMATPPQSMQAATVARGTPPSRASTSQKPAPQRSPLGLSPLGRLAPTVPGSAGRMSGQKRGRTAGESPGSDAAGRGARKLQAGASGGEEMATPVLRRRQVEDSPRDRVMLGLGAAVGPGSMEAAAGEVDTPSQIVRARQVMHAGKTPHKTRAVVGAEGGTADVTPTGASSRPRAPRVPATPSVLKSSKPGPRIKRRRSVTFHPDVVGGTSPPASPGASRMQSARGESSKGWLTAVSDFVRYWVMPRSSQ